MNVNAPITIIVPVGWKIRLIEISQERTIDSQKNITISRLIREALEKVYDLNHDGDEKDR